MAVHFSAAELAERRARACVEMARRGLDGLLLFRQESMYYLSGYDSFGFCFFQCLYLAGDGRMALLTRAPDLRQAQHTSVIEDIRIWVDKDGATPAEDLKAVLDDLGAAGARLGVEWQAHALPAADGRRLADTLDDFCRLHDASDLVARLRAIKSASELDYVRRAAELGDAAWDAALAGAGPGAFEGDILADMHGAIFRGGGDYPGNSFIIGSGPDALLCRYHSGRRTLDPQDQLTLEFAGIYRHYHACLMRTLVVGGVAPQQQQMFELAREALLAVEAALQPGRPMGEAFDAHAAVLDAAGMAAHRLNACGYSLGATYAPSWMDWPMLYHGNPELVVPGMVIFAHMIIFDDDAGLAMTLGRTSEITEAGAEPLSQAALELVVR